MPVLFAADIHLSAQRPEQVDRFVAFLSGPCRHARSVYLLGDIFDEWLGDDDARDPHPRIVQALGELTRSGTHVAFIHGNHDFLTGEAFAQQSGCTLLTQPCLIDVYGTQVVVLHGDQLCTRDEDYQRWRATFMDPQNQRGFLALGFAERTARAAALRHESRDLTRLKPDDIMDVTESAVVEVLRAHNACHMVHGHTHRPKVHDIEVNGQPGLRAVVGDWYVDDIVLCWDESGPRLVSASTLPGQAP
jgi:UDP-2,3-diacylglucosamine hydrolase